MTTYTRDEKLKLSANFIAVGAAIFSLIGAGISAYPLIQESSRQTEHRESLVAGLAGDEPSKIKAARTHVVASSPADVFLVNVDDWWYAADWAIEASKTPTPEAGSWQHEGNGYRVCLPKLLPGDQVCLKLANFIYDPDNGLITRFSVDGVPVDSMSWDKSPSKDLIPKDRDLPLDVRAIGRIDLSSQDVRCVSYTIDMETRGFDGDSKKVLYFNTKQFETQDINEQHATHRLLWPRHLNGFQKATAVVCVPDYGGWIKIARQKSAKDTTVTAITWLGVS